jgi:hypothetical protein
VSRLYRRILDQSGGCPGDDASFAALHETACGDDIVSVEPAL